MPITDIFKRRYPKVGATPAESDAPTNIQQAFDMFSKTIHALVPVASDTEASTIAAQAPVEAFPLFVWNDPQQSLKVKREASAPWETIAGRQPGIQTVLAHASHPEAVATFVNNTNIARASEGWQISANGQQITVPAEGLYLLSVRMRVGDKAKGLGRTFVEFVIDGTPYRVGAPDDNHVSATIALQLPASSKIAIRLFHESNGSVAVTGEFTAAQLINPRWAIVG